MLRLITMFLASFFAIQFYGAHQAHAQDCPDYYRFVDFGLKDSKGTLYRGGIVLRAEGFSAEALLLEDKTQCLKVRDLAKDGHGNPIPVVASVDYIPQIIGIGLQTLRVTKSTNTTQAANKNASSHLARMQKPGAEITHGENFVCAKDTNAQALSCQLVSPYAGNTALVIHCKANTCQMPVMAINAELMVTAVWESSDELLNNPQTAGTNFTTKAQQIHDFLKPLSAAL